jgi:hypothetical protein
LAPTIRRSSSAKRTVKENNLVPQGAPIRPEADELKERDVSLRDGTAPKQYWREGEFPGMVVASSRVRAASVSALADSGRFRVDGRGVNRAEQEYLRYRNSDRLPQVGWFSRGMASLGALRRDADERSDDLVEADSGNRSTITEKYGNQTLLRPLQKRDRTPR